MYRENVGQKKVIGVARGAESVQSTGATSEYRLISGWLVCSVNICYGHQLLHYLTIRHALTKTFSFIRGQTLLLRAVEVLTLSRYTVRPGRRVNNFHARN